MAAAKLPDSICEALKDCVVDGGEDAPEMDQDWGEPGFTPAEKVYGWCTFANLAITAGNPETPVNAIPLRASAHCQIRFTVDVDYEQFLPSLRRHLDKHGFQQIQVTPAKKAFCVSHGSIPPIPR